MTLRSVFTASKVAVFELPATGDANAPYFHPEAHLDLVHLHTDFDNYSQVASATVEVTHAAFSADPGTALEGGLITDYSTETVTNRVLLSYANPGYVPRFAVFASISDSEIPQGFPIQSNTTSGGRRWVDAYATSTEIVLVERTIQSNAALAALTVTYTAIAYRGPGVVSGDPGFLGTPSHVILASGRIDSNVPNLRVPASGETGQIYLPLAECIGYDNGQIKVIAGDGTAYITGRSGTQAFGGNGGSFTGTPGIAAVLA